MPDACFKKQNPLVSGLWGNSVRLVTDAERERFCLGKL